MPKRRYTEAEKAEALAFLDANRGNFKATSRQTLIPAQTIKNWDMGRSIGPEVTNLVTQKRAEIDQRLDDAIHRMLDGMPGKIDEASLKDTFTSLGIAVDKMQLLRNKPTAITENGSITDDERIARIAALLDRGRDRRDRQPSSIIEPESGNRQQLPA